MSARHLLWVLPLWGVLGAAVAYALDAAIYWIPIWWAAL